MDSHCPLTVREHFEVAGGAMALLAHGSSPRCVAITVPTDPLAGRLEWPTTLGALTLTTPLLVLARWFGQVSLRRYLGASA